MDLKVPDFINLGIAGLLSMLWTDIRRFNRDRTDDKVKHSEETGEFREELFAVFLTKEKHVLLCENAALRIREHISQEVRASEIRILEAIKNNGKGANSWPAGK